MSSELVLRDTRYRVDFADWLTVERAAYAGIALLALGVRLVALGRTALGPAEAAQALSAWAAASGQAAPLIGVSPLLWAVQRLVFAAFGAGDFWARFLPALLGGLAPLCFWALRDRLSRGGALIAALLWALSPLAVFTGRLGLGEGLVAPLALALLAALARFDHGRAETGSDTAGRPALTAAAVALGFLLISGGGAYTALLAAGLALLWQPAAAAALWSAVKANGRNLLLVLLTPLVLGATFFLTAPTGLAAAGDLLGQWALGLRPGAGEYTWWEIVRRLLLSEQLLLGFGVAGAIRAWRREEQFGRWASLAALIVAVAAVIGQGRHPASLALVVVGLTLLAGPVIAGVLRRVRLWRAETDPWLLIALSCVLLMSALFCLPGAWNPVNTEEWRRLYTAIGIVTAVLAALIWLVYGIWGEWRTVARAMPVLGLLFGLGWGIGQLVGLSYDRAPGHQAAALATVVAPDAANFAATVADLSAFKGGGARDARIDLVWADRPGDSMLPVLRWQLRDFPNLRVSPAGAVPADPAPIVITAAEDQPALKNRYSGAEFPILRTWQPRALGSFNADLRWVLYREAKTEPQLQKVIVWVDRTQK